MSFSTRFVQILFLVLVFHNPSIAQKRWRFSPLPVVYYSPETKLGFGVLLGANTNFGKDSLTTGTYLQTSFIYTLNKQYEWSNIGRIYTEGNRRIVDYRLYYAFFPEYYYGYQTEQPDLYEQSIAFNRIWIELKHLWEIRSHMYVGAYGRFNRIYELYMPNDRVSQTPLPPGGKGYHVAGLSPLFLVDSRDSQVYPRQGTYFEFQWVGHPGLVSDFVYGNVRMDFRCYKKLGLLKDDVIATQVFLNLNEGIVPFRDMADLGGSNTMRGYYRGYYRYKNLYAWQTEYRFMVHKYFGFAVWGGLASLSENWSAPFNHPVKPNAGIGLRLRINQTDKLNLRADYGFGKNQQGLYLDASEAF